MDYIHVSFGRLDSSGLGIICEQGLGATDDVFKGLPVWHGNIFVSIEYTSVMLNSSHFRAE